MAELFLSFDADVNAIDNEGLTALMAACKRGHASMARLLTAAGAVVNRTDRNDFCALLYAAEAGHLDCVEHLVSACEWPVRRDCDLGLGEALQQAATLAASNGRTEVLEFLLDMAEVSLIFIFSHIGNNNWNSTRIAAYFQAESQRIVLPFDLRIDV